MRAEDRFKTKYLIERTIKEQAKEIIITDSSDKYILTDLVREQLPFIDKNIIVKYVALYFKIFGLDTY